MAALENRGLLQASLPRQDCPSHGRRMRFARFFPNNMPKACFGLSSQRSSYLSKSQVSRICFSSSASTFQETLRLLSPYYQSEGIFPLQAFGNSHPCIDTVDRNKRKRTISRHSIHRQLLAGSLHLLLSGDSSATHIEPARTKVLLLYPLVRVAWTCHMNPRKQRSRKYLQCPAMGIYSFQNQGNAWGPESDHRTHYTHF